jgi:phage-related minor tail protein
MSGNAEFGIKIKVDGGQAAAADIDKINAATARVGDTAAATSRKLTDSQKALSDSTDKLTIGQTHFLETLEKQAETAGLSRAELLKYQAAQLGVSNQAAQYIQKIQGATSATHSFSLASAGASRELLVMSHEAVTGNFSRLGGSMMVLANQTGLAGAAFSAAGLAAIGATAAVLGLVVAVAKGHEEMVAMNNAIAVTNNFAGQTRTGMESLARSMTATKEVTIGTANEIVTQLVASGRIGQQAIAQVAHLASDFAKATGKDIDQIAPELIKLFADPAKGAEELNRSMHFLTVTDLEHIRTLERLGQTQEAQRVLAEKLTAQIPKQADNVGTVTKAINVQIDAWTKLIQAVKDYGKTKTDSQKAQDLRDELTEYKNRGVSPKDPNYIAVEQQLEQQEKLAQVEKNNAKAAADVAAANDLQAKSWDSVTKASQLYGVKQIELQKKLVQDFKPTDSTQAADKADALRRLNKEIEDGYRAIGAEGRQLAQQESASTLQVDELRLKGQEEEIQGMHSLGQLRKIEADAAIAAIALERNDAKKAYEERILQIGGLTKSEKAHHVAELEAAAQEEQRLLRHRDIIRETDEKAEWDEVYKSIIAVGDADIKRLNDAIRAQKEHNAEIGKTAEEKALVKKRIEDQTTAQLEDDAVFLDRALKENDFDEKSKAAYELRLQMLQAEIVKRKELTGLISESAVLERSAEETKRQQEEWKSVASTLESSIDDAIANGGQSALRKLKAEAVKTAFQIPVQFVAGNLASLFTGASPTGSTLLSAFGNGASAYNSLGNLGSLSSAVGLDGAYNTVAGWLGATGAGITGGGTAVGAASSLGGSGLFAADAGYYGAAAAADAGAAAGAAAGASITSSLSSAVAAVPGWGWAIAGAALLYTSFNGGETRQGGQYGVGFDGQTLYNNRRGSAVSGATSGVNFLEGPSGGEIDGANVRTAITATVSGINDLLKQMGSSASLVGFQAGLESSGEGRGGVFAGGRLSTGSAFGQSGAGDNYAGTLFDSAFSNSPDSAQALKDFSTELKQTTIEALRAAADIPKAIADQLKDVDVKHLTDDAATKLLTSISTEITAVNQLREALNTLPQQFNNLKNLSFDAADGLIKAAGGVANLQQGLASFVQNFYTDDERAQAVQADVAKKMADLGFAAVTTKEEFRDLVQSLDVTTAAGAKTAAALLALAPEFAQAADYAKKMADETLASAKQAADEAAKAAQEAEQQRQQAISDARSAVADAYQRESSALQSMIDKLSASAKALREFRDSLLTGNLSPLSPTQKLETLRSQVSQTYALAQAGDPEAGSKLQALSQQFLQASQSVNASSTAYARDFDWIRSMLDGAAKAADTQVDIARAQLAEMQKSVAGIVDIGKNMLSLSDALKEYFHLGGTADGASGTGDAAGTSGIGALGIFGGGWSDVDQATKMGVVQSWYADNPNANKSPTQDDLSYWANKLVSGVGAGDIQTLFNKVVAQNTGTAYNPYDMLVGTSVDQDKVNKLRQEYAAGLIDEHGNAIDGSHENGLDYVPFNGYRAVLHEREGVLTASENKEYRSGKNSKDVAAAIEKQTAAMSQQADAMNRLADTIQSGQGKATDDMRTMLQHLTHAASKRRVAA